MSRRAAKRRHYRRYHAANGGRAPWPELPHEKAFPGWPNRPGRETAKNRAR